MNTKDIAIIGGGPGGITAAIQLKRCGFNPILFEGKQLGGLIRNAHQIENYPAFPNGISGKAFAERLTRHFKTFPCPVVPEEIKRLGYYSSKDRFLLKTRKHTHEFIHVIVATGTRAKKLHISATPERLRTKILYEPVPLRDACVVIAGGGDAAFDYALTLARHNRVFLLVREDKPKALPRLMKQVLATPSINCKRQCQMTALKQGKKKAILAVARLKDKEISLEADVILAAIGREAQKDFYDPELFSKEKELLVRRRLFLVGDVGHPEFRQAAIAAGDALRAAMQLERNLR